MIEKWKDIDGYEGYYQVSNFGEVRTVGHKYQRKGFHKIKLHSNHNGYWLADLHKNNLYKSKAIHRLVAKAFIPNPNNFPEVNHIDGNKANNCVDNLEWVSKSQNKWHACNVLGQRTNRIKDFSTGNVFPSQKSAALYYGVSESLIRSIVKKQIFSKRKKKQEITNHRIEIISEREYIDSLNKSKLVDAVNELQTKVNKLAPNINFAQPEVKENAQEAKKNHKIRSTKERLREALSLAENALTRLANEAYDMNQHVYIDAILSRIDKITKGGDNE